MPIAEAAAIVTSLKNASDLVGKALAANPKDAGPISDLLINARLAVLELIEKQAILRDEIARLNERVEAVERENRKLLDFGEQSEKYERVKLRYAFVYREKNPPGGDAGAPYLCPKCFGENKARPLQPGYGYSGNEGYCVTCKTSVSLSE